MREEGGQPSEELSSLRRVATLVAEGVEPLDLFAVVAEEVAHVVDVPVVGIARYESDGTATECASYSPHGPQTPIGTRWSFDGGTNVLRLVREQSSPARIDDYSQLEGEVAEAVRRRGIRSSVASPIIVEGALWGAMVVASAEALRQGTEERLAEFTALLATAIANAESRAAVARLAAEQSALRRVATLVARGVPPDEIFLAVCDALRRVFQTAVAAVGRFDPDAPALDAVGLGGGQERWALEDWMATTQVFHSGRSARSEASSWASAQGPAAERLKALGLVSTVASPIVVEGRLWGAMFVGSTENPLPLDTEARLESFTELIATAIANAESRSELSASRRRIVAASDEARRRIERDLHDGTQQRLISLAMAVRAVERSVGGDPDELRSALAEVARGLADAANDLQELSRGIHPAVLANGGLGPALREVAHRSASPVEFDVAIAGRLPEQCEIAAYFVVSEALANAAKHARASRVAISARVEENVLRLSIDDDGVGGVDPGRGSGLVGLRDRVEALGGSISISSPPRGGTHIVAELPLEQPG
jgi:signal transduction histidine kinase